ncbi:MAG: hypothetical protein QOE63_1002 [Acidimicrobiaceae bacterium]|jgi:hypothetical protein
MADIEEDVWLLQNALNPFPVAAHAKLAGGRLTVTLNPMAKDAFTGWIEKEIDDPDVKAKAAAGEAVRVFEVDVNGVEVGWPKQFMGSTMKVASGGRDWLVSLVYPSGSLYTTYKTFKHRGASKAWRQALEGAGAK